MPPATGGHYAAVRSGDTQGITSITAEHGRHPGPLSVHIHVLLPGHLQRS